MLLYFDFNVRGNSPQGHEYIFSASHVYTQYFKAVRNIPVAVCRTSRCQVGNVCSVSSQNTKASGTRVECREDRLSLDLKITFI